MGMELIGWRKIGGRAGGGSTPVPVKRKSERFRRKKRLVQRPEADESCPKPDSRFSQKWPLCAGKGFSKSWQIFFLQN
jgi:hypothetical protein